jgi:hypothetical protein
MTISTFSQISIKPNSHSLGIEMRMMNITIRVHPTQITMLIRFGPLSTLPSTNHPLNTHKKMPHLKRKGQLSYSQEASQNYWKLSLLPCCIILIRKICSPCLKIQANTTKSIMTQISNARVICAWIRRICHLSNPCRVMVFNRLEDRSCQINQRIIVKDW